MNENNTTQWTESYLAGFVAGYNDGIKLDDYGLYYSLREYDTGYYAGMDAACDDAVADDMDNRPELAEWDRLAAGKEKG